MPIYEYQCSKCGEVFEAFQKINDSPLTECKFCQGRVEKLISHSSFQLKGAGWYLTDYARKTTPPDSAAGSKDAAKTDKAGESKPSTETAKNDKKD